MSKKKLYVITGEASGDLHGSNLVKELNTSNEIEVLGMGGELLKAAGANILHNYKEVNYMGFVDVAKHLRTILKKISVIKKEIATIKPDAVLLIDFPSFNLRIAKFCKKIGVKVIYYISPQIWAWKQGRVKQIKAYVDEMICILPFEKEFYKKFDHSIHYVGHPLLDAMRTYPYNEKFIEEIKVKADHKPIIALLPGSRKSEIRSKLPVMTELANLYKEKYQFVIAAAPGADKSLYADTHLQVYYGETYNILKASFAALVTSGTATLETALHKVPQIVCYRTSEFNYQAAKRLIKVDYISLVNLILNKPAVVELIQRDLNIDRLKKEFENITGNGRKQILQDYNTLIEVLSESGASKRAAGIIKKAIL